jgi:hypothetical protein
MAQLLMVDEILITQCDPKHPLADQCRHLVLHQFRRAAVRETTGKPVDKPDRPIRRTQQQRTRIGSDLTAVNRRHDRAPFDTCKAKQIHATLRLHRVSPWPLALRQTVATTRFSQIQGSDAPAPFEKCGLAQANFNERPPASRLGSGRSPRYAVEADCGTGFLTFCCVIGPLSSRLNVGRFDVCTGVRTTLRWSKEVLNPRSSE